MSDPMIIRRSLGSSAVLTGCIALHVLAGWYLGYGIIDDTYISLRYAENLIEGLGLVFNPGERVEGYSNFLWTLILAGGSALGLEGPRFAVMAGLACSCASLVVTFILVRSYLAPKQGVLRAAAAPLCVAISAPVLTYAASGMETAFFTLLLVGSVALLYAGLRSVPGLLASAVLLAAANLTRAETTPLFLYNLVFLLLYSLQKSSSLRRSSILGYALLYGSIVGTFFLWRHHYYGSWLPNTYYAKVGAFNFTLAGTGLTYVARFLLESCLAAVLPLLLLSRSFRSDPRRLYLVGFLAALLGAVILEGGDHLAMFRFCVPVLPVTAILYGELYARLWDRGTLRFPALRRVAPPAVLALTLATGVSSSLWIARTAGLHGMSEHDRALFEVRLAAQWAGFGRWLRSRSEAGDSIALLPVGAIGYYSGLDVVDMAGLTDTHIARLPVRTGAAYIGHEKFDNRYVLGRRPRFILAHHLVEFGSIDERTYNASAYFPAHQELVRMPELHDAYRYRSVRVGPGTYYSFYERRDRILAGSGDPAQR